MTTQQQRQQIDISQAKAKTRKWLSKRVVLVSIVIIVAAVVTTIWTLSNLKIIPGSWATIFTTIIAVLGAVFAFLQVMHAASSSSQQLAPIIVHIPPTESLPPQPTFEKPAHRGIAGFPPRRRGCKMKCVSWLSMEELRRRKVEEEIDDHSTRIDRRIAERLLRSA
jgi:hypothetical protein